MYDRYTDFVARIVDNSPLNFKSDPNYTYMLEHTDEYMLGMAQEQARILVDSGISVNDIKEFVVKNDSVGYPVKRAVFPDLKCSPTSVRYCYHSVMALRHFKKFSDDIDVVEVGGGYGGLCLAFHYFAAKIGVNIKSYTIVDLEDPQNLQKRYLSEFGIAPSFVPASTYGRGVSQGSYLVANYSFSEFDAETRTSYQKILFPNIIHGFMAWNFIPLYNFGFETLSEPEVPLTGKGNLHVYF
jgi:hypothetical protein